jgi:hypothetical protein
VERSRGVVQASRVAVQGCAVDLSVIGWGVICGGQRATRPASDAHLAPNTPV